jgi:hypothetical protein
MPLFERSLPLRHSQAIFVRKIYGGFSHYRAVGIHDDPKAPVCRTKRQTMSPFIIINAPFAYAGDLAVSQFAHQNWRRDTKPICHHSRVHLKRTFGEFNEPHLPHSSAPLTCRALASFEQGWIGALGQGDLV